MKKIICLVLGICLVASSGVAQEASQNAEVAQKTEAAAAPETAQSAPQMETLKGILIDNMCADANKDTLDDFMKIHAKDCATQPACVASGYSLVVDGKALKLDAGSSAKVAEYLNDPVSKLDVVVDAAKMGDELAIASIKNA